MRALVTGVSGFLGRHVAEALRREGAEVHGICRSGVAVASVTIHCGDVLDGPFLRSVIDCVAPTHVFHLAAMIGMATPAAALYDVNVIGTHNLLDALIAARSPSRVLVSSSSAVYGHPVRLPVAENHRLLPTTDYAASKAAEEMVAISFRARGLDLVRLRPFNLIGPGQPDSLVSSAVARQIVRAEEEGKPGVIRIGSTRAKRDYTDVRDAAGAYVAVARLDAPEDVYNVCSGESHSVQETLDLLVSMARVPLSIATDPTLIRAVDIEDQVGSSKRLRQCTGWKPGISFRESLCALLEAQRQGAEAARRTS